MRIGVLALQGGFAEHCDMLKKLHAEPIEIRQRKDFDNLDGLIIPGGESTVIEKLLRELALLQPIKDAVLSGLPTFGTCAGLILLAKQIENGGAGAIPVLDITARRNAYGRQLGSFAATANVQDIGEVPMVFIRAPYVVEAHGKATPLAVVDGKIVAVKQGAILATAFHPELTAHTGVHEYFLRGIEPRFFLRIRQ